MNIFVLNKNGNPLTPCRPAKARHLLNAGRAEVVGLFPFTVRLLWDCEENTQPVTVGIDKGSKETGFCCVGNGQILLSGQINHRTDIKKRWRQERGTEDHEEEEGGTGRHGSITGHLQREAERFLRQSGLMWRKLPELLIKYLCP
ncbi:MAG: hypothetical protein B6245_22775 [Desulfobacteraceae bacterium 4572_88]|nr:MAG: hypothetical protein B6245_22775 [Desulfobacteraceae bacterium 4572_88]RLC05603.1 MAG: hypothetical protein DRI57_27430 [Deltaproteobacteria bacterium]